MIGERPHVVERVQSVQPRSAAPLLARLVALIIDMSAQQQVRRQGVLEGYDERSHSQRGNKQLH